jgi:hypothetical protein
MAANKVSHLAIGHGKIPDLRFHFGYGNSNTQDGESQEGVVCRNFYPLRLGIRDMTKHAKSSVCLANRYLRTRLDLFCSEKSLRYLILAWIPI